MSLKRYKMIVSIFYFQQSIHPIMVIQKSKEKTDAKGNPCPLLAQTINIFCERTSISGISNAGNKNNHSFRRACWMIIFLIFSGLTFYGLWEVINEYMNYPVITSVKIENKEKV